MVFDIYTYFNSPDVAEHCRRIGHIFTPLEKAVLIAMSERPASQRLDGYRALLPEAEGFRFCTKAMSSKYGASREFELGGFLREVIRCQLSCGASRARKKRLPSEEDLTREVYIYVPAPFEPGDILECRYSYGNKPYPVVLAALDYEKSPEAHQRHFIFGDTTDMCARVYSIQDGLLCSGIITPYTDLRYYRGQLPHEQRALEFFSWYAQNGCDDGKLMDILALLRQDDAKEPSGLAEKINENMEV